jgi:hypothetical protein
MDDELATSKSTSGQDDDYMEEEGEGDESVRAVVRVLDEDSDGEEGVEAIGGTQLTRDNMLKGVTAVSIENVNKELKEQAKKIGCGSVQSGKNVIRKTKKQFRLLLSPLHHQNCTDQTLNDFPNTTTRSVQTGCVLTTRSHWGGGGHGCEGWCGASLARQWFQHSK